MLIICSNDPLGNALTAPVSKIFSIDSRVDEYAQLMDASEKVMSVNEEKDDESAINIDRYLQNAVDQQPIALDSWSSEKVPKVELKQLPAGLKYAFLYENSYPVIVNVNLSTGELALLLNKLCKYTRALGYSLDDIPGISPHFCMHRIHLEDGSTS